MTLNLTLAFQGQCNLFGFSSTQDQRLGFNVKLKVTIELRVKLL